MRNGIIFIAGLGMFLSGCVSMGTYEKNMRAAAKQRQDLEAKVAELEGQTSLLQQSVKEKDAQLVESKKAYDDLVASLQQEIKDGSVGVESKGGKLTITVGSMVLFKSGQADLQPKGQKIMKKVGEAVKNIKDQTLRIEGHTDNVPVSNSLKARFPGNWTLSAARAASVARYLESLHVIASNQLLVVGYADTHPVADNRTAQGRAQNRRVEISLVPNEPQEYPAEPEEEK